MRRTILPHRAGLFSNINKVVAWLAAEPDAQVGVLWPAGPEMIYGSPSEGSIWDQLFQPLGPLDALPTREWPNVRYTGKHVAALYGSHAWRVQLHSAWTRITVRPEIIAEADSFCSHFTGRSVAAVHVRNSHHGAQESPDGARSPLSAFSDAVGPGNAVFLATDHLEAVDHFRARFGRRLHVRDLPRVPDSHAADAELHTHRPPTVADARDCLIDMLIMSRCQHLISGVSNIATAVQYANPAIPHTFIRQPHASADPVPARWRHASLRIGTG